MQTNLSISHNRFLQKTITLKRVLPACLFLLTLFPLHGKDVHTKRNIKLFTEGDPISVVTSMGLMLGPCSKTDITCYTLGSVSAGTVTGATGPVSYTWRDSGNKLVGTTATVSGLPAGVYNLTVQDNVSSASCSVTIAPSLEIGPCTKTDATCVRGGSVTAGTVSFASGPVSYTWRNTTFDRTTNPIVGTTPSVSNLPAGTYTLTVNDICNQVVCSVTILMPGINLGACTATEATCKTGGTVTAGAVGNTEGAVTYTWRNAANVIVGTTPSVANLPVGAYTLTVKDNCSQTTGSVNVVQTTKQLALGGCAKDDATCRNGGTVLAGAVISSVGAVSYTWRNAANAVVGTTAVVRGLAGGTYTLTAQDDCSQATCSVTVAAFTRNPLTLGVCSKTDVNCSTLGSVSAGAVSNAIGEVRYTWRTKSDFDVVDKIVGTTPTVSGLPANNYVLTVEDDCDQVTCRVTVSELNNFSMGACTSTDANCFDGGSVSAGPITGAVGVVTYMWRKISSDRTSDMLAGLTARVTGLTPGSYTLVAKDNCISRSCTVTVGKSCWYGAAGSDTAKPTDKLSEEPTLQFYPNPTTNEINLTFDHFIGDKVTLSLYNMLGALVSTQQIDNSQSFSLKLKDKTPNAGLYFLKISDGVKQVSKMVTYE